MQSSQRLYPGLNTITSTATMTRYSPTGTGATTAAAAYRTRMPSVGIHKTHHSFIINTKFYLFLSFTHIFFSIILFRSSLLTQKYLPLHFSILSNTF